MSLTRTVQTPCSLQAAVTCGQTSRSGPSRQPAAPPASSAVRPAQRSSNAARRGPAASSRHSLVAGLDAPEPYQSLPGDGGAWLSVLFADQQSLVAHLEDLYRLSGPSTTSWAAASPSASVLADTAARLAPPLAAPLAVQLTDPPSPSPPAPPGGGGKDDDFYVNAGTAIRTLREDIPALFSQDLNYDIYREDVVFRDPRNKFSGIKNYKTIFWSLRFHGKLFFRLLYVDVLRIWQPEDKVIKMRWKVHGVPRIPWEAEGTFDGISTYKLDKHGKIYEHQVDNVIFRDTPRQVPLFARINLMVPAQQQQQQPCPGAWYKDERPAPHWLAARFSWVRLYAALLGTLKLAHTPGGRDDDTPVLDGSRMAMEQ